MLLYLIELPSARVAFFIQYGAPCHVTEPMFRAPGALSFWGDRFGRGQLFLGWDDDDAHQSVLVPAEALAKATYPKLKTSLSSYAGRGRQPFPGPPQTCRVWVYSPGGMEKGEKSWKKKN